MKKPNCGHAHREACDQGLEFYIDPDTGYQVFTELYLRARGHCCDSGCRHCPYKGEIVSQREVATLAGGCFWGMEDILRQLPGVLDTQVGYTGGKTENPRYEQVKKGDTGHAEAIEITFDASKISFEKILHTFFRMHDPTTSNRQGNDIGSQYRSAIFFHSEAQKTVAEKVKADTEKSGKWKKPIVTEIVPAVKFYSAEDYHQDYLVKNPGGYTCHFLRD